MEIFNVKGLKIIDVLTMTSPVGYQVAFPPYNNVLNYQKDDKELDTPMYFRIHEILHFATVKTEDKMVHHCFCFLDEYESITWIDENTSDNNYEEFWIINYDNYKKNMENLGLQPLNYLNYICQNTLCDFVVPPKDINLNCSMREFLSTRNHKSNFELRKISNGFYQPDDI